MAPWQTPPADGEIAAAARFRSIRWDARKLRSASDGVLLKKITKQNYINMLFAIVLDKQGTVCDIHAIVNVNSFPTYQRHGPFTFCWQPDNPITAVV
jgi:hypothetical protein